MSLKDTIVQWSQGVDLALEGKLAEAVAEWSAMQEPGARIYFNVACMHMLLGSIGNAERNLDQAIEKDPHLAIAYFQRGNLHLQKERYADALKDFDSAQKTLRGNQLIDYKQLGLQYKLYSCEVMYNHAYGLYCTGRTAEAREELEGAKAIAANTTESRHKIIVAALDNIRRGTKFQPYKLPEKAMIFQPPRNKREAFKPVNFLGKAKVLSSVVDQDSYVGFVGVQEEKQRQARTPSPRPGGTQPHSAPSKQPKPAMPPPARMPKPDIPPPAPEMRIRSRTSSLQGKEALKTRTTTDSKKANLPSRPPKPASAPPPLLASNKAKSPVGNSKLPDNGHKKVGPSKSKSLGMMTVKVHYSTTRALRVSTSITYQQLQNLICKKFGQPEDSLTLWCKKKNGELSELKCEQSLKEVSALLDDGFRLTLWAYDKHDEGSDTGCDEEDEDPVLFQCVATHPYKGQYEDELTFKAGDMVEVTADINSDWYEGRCNGLSGIFPKSYVKVQ